MTSREFESKYKVLKQIAGGAGRSYTAQARTTGRAVLVHVFEPASGAELASLIERLPPLDRAKVVEVLSVDGSTVVVTQVLEGFQSLDAWVRGRVPGATEPGPEPGAAPAGSAGGSGFTELFRPPERPASAEAPAPPRAPAPAGFTDLFAAPSRTPPPAPPSPPPPRTPVASVPPVRMVDLRVPQPRLTDRGEAPPPALRPNLSGSGSAAPQLPPPSQPRALDEPLITAPPARPITPPPPPAWSGPSDFTRQLERGPHLGGDAPAVLEPPPPPEPAPAGRVSILPLLVATNLITMLLTGLVVYFAFGRR